MLSRKGYPTEDVERCRRTMNGHVDAFREVVDEIQPATADTFAPRFFNNLVIALDHWFVHRMRGAEGKDGNALNEVRVVVASLVDHDGVLTQDKNIRLDPDASILGIGYGEPIAISADQFCALTEAFLAELVARYPEAAG